MPYALCYGLLAAQSMLFWIIWQLKEGNSGNVSCQPGIND